MRRHALRNWNLWSVAAIALTIVGPQAPTRALAQGLTVSSPAANPGQQVSFTVVLSTGGAQVAGLQADLRFEAVNTPVSRRASGRPNCTVNPAIGKSGAFGFLPPDCSASSCTSMRAIVFAIDSLDPIPDASVLFTCTIDVSSVASAGRHPITLENVIFNDPNGVRPCGPGPNDRRCDAANGAVVVTDLPAPTASRSVTPTASPTATFTSSPTASPTETPTATLTPTDTPTATATPTPPACAGDCDGSGDASVDELLILTNVALGNAPLQSCQAGDSDGDGAITIDDILSAVNVALLGCV